MTLKNYASVGLLIGLGAYIRYMAVAPQNWFTWLFTAVISLVTVVLILVFAVDGPPTKGQS